MFSAMCLLVLACAVTISAQAAQCGEAQIGTLPTSHAVKLQSVHLDPFNLDWRVTVSPIVECVYGVSGLHAFTCDTDVPPSGYFTDLNNLMVHRNGNLQGVGSVSVTVYCKV